MNSSKMTSSQLTFNSRQLKAQENESTVRSRIKNLLHSDFSRCPWFTMDHCNFLFYTSSISVHHVYVFKMYLSLHLRSLLFVFLKSNILYFFPNGQLNNGRINPSENHFQIVRIVPIGTFYVPTGPFLDSE